MSDFRIFETEQFSNDLRQLAQSGKSAMVRKLREIVYAQLRRNPHFGPNIRKLKNYSPETWRYRIGAWRFFYQINNQEKTVFMIAASHRGSSY